MIFKKFFKGIQWRSILQELLMLNFDDTKEYTIEIKEKKRKRSLDANAYFWLFLDKLVAKTGVDKKTAYRELIRDIGGVSDILLIKKEAVDTYIENWEKRGLGWFTEKLDREVKGWIYIVVYYGSSTYDTAQMSRLIELLMLECRECEIDTTPLRERALLEGFDV